MTDFISWFAVTISQWWLWLIGTQVPGCSFSFATLLLAVFFINFSFIIIQFIIHKDNGGKETK